MGFKNISSIKQFSEITELPYRTAQSYLNGDREPNVSGLTKLCTQLGINLNWLLTGIGAVFIDDERTEEQILSSEDQKLMKMFGELTTEQRRAVLEVSKVFAQPKPNKTAG